MTETHRRERAQASPAIAGTSTALPPHRYDQEALAHLAGEVLPALDVRPGTLARFFRRVGVGARYLALPPQAYRQLDGFGSRNRAWLETALDLGERALTQLFADAELDPREVGLLATTTVTGLAVPSLDARLMNRLPLSPRLKRVPLFGLGCAGGAAGVARVSEYLRAYPDQAAVLLAVELCSLTVQRDDASLANVISTGLFGDGAAAVLLVGPRHRLARTASPRILDTRAHFFEDSERVMGWDMVDTGFKVVLSPDVPQLVEGAIGPFIGALLADHGLERDDVAAWVAHPGGPKVIDAVERGLGLDPDALAASRESLAEVGNLSSASVLFVLDEIRRRRRPARDRYGVMLAMGPAFAAEALLLRW